MRRPGPFQPTVGELLHFPRDVFLAKCCIFWALWRPKYYPGILFEIWYLTLDVTRLGPVRPTVLELLHFARAMFSRQNFAFLGSLTYKVLAWHPSWENSEFRFDIQLRTSESLAPFDQWLGSCFIFLESMFLSKNPHCLRLPDVRSISLTCSLRKQ